MARPVSAPLGLRLAQAAKAVSRAFDDALAEAIGIRGPTLTHHLDVLESAGLVTRRRDPENRRVHLVRLTPAGDALFLRLSGAVAAFDQRLRSGLSPHDVAEIERLLDRLRDNAGEHTGQRNAGS